MDDFASDTPRKPAPRRLGYGRVIVLVLCAASILGVGFCAYAVTMAMASFAKALVDDLLSAEATLYMFAVFAWFMTLIGLLTTGQWVPIVVGLAWWLAST